MNISPTPLHTRNGGNVVEDGRALKRRKPWYWHDLFYKAFSIGVAFAFGGIYWLQNSP